MFIIYDDPTGDIGHTIGGPEPESYGALLTQQGLSWIFDPEFKGEIWNHYVKNRKIVARPDFPIRQIGNKFNGVPSGCGIIVRLGAHELARETIFDGSFELDATEGEYSVQFSLRPYRQQSYDVVIP